MVVVAGADLGILRVAGGGGGGFWAGLLQGGRGRVQVRRNFIYCQAKKQAKKKTSEGGLNP